MDKENFYTLRYKRDWATKRRGKVETNHDKTARDFLVNAGIAEDVTQTEIKKRGRKKRNNKK